MRKIIGNILKNIKIKISNFFMFLIIMIISSFYLLVKMS